VTRLLIHKPAFETIQPELAALGDRVEAQVMDETGAITLAGKPVAAEAADIEAAWFSGDLYQAPAARAFFSAILGAPKLKWVHTASAGVDNAVFGRIVAKGAKLTTSHGQAVGIADYVIAGVLDTFQRWPERRAAQAAREWRELEVREVNGSTWLLIGFGAIGGGVATRAKAFGARIIGVRRNQAPDPLADEIAPMDAIPRLLPAADVVVLSAPLNPATRHLANDAFFQAMKPGSVLVNVGRGGLVDEAALLRALDRGIPAHAVLDVFETEPLPADSPFWAHPRVSLTAHCSGVTGAQNERNRLLFLDNLGRYLAGQKLLNEIDPKDVAAGG
jgi:phosphoglycerate dehydrogenase-like enzyme